MIFFISTILVAEETHTEQNGHRQCISLSAIIAAATAAASAVTLLQQQQSNTAMAVAAATNATTNLCNRHSAEKNGRYRRAGALPRGSKSFWRRVDTVGNDLVFLHFTSLTRESFDNLLSLCHEYI